MTQDRPLLGIMLMLGFCVVAPMGDAVAKLLGQSVPLGELLFVRFAIQAVILIPLVWVGRRLWKMRGRVLRLTALRTVLHIFGIGTMFTALQYLPLADAVAIAFVMPFMMLILGKYVLGEEVGSRRLIACIVGFVGTLMVVQPSFAEVGWPALLPVVCALNFSIFMLVTRQIAKETDPIGLQAVSGVMAVIILGPILWASQGAGIAPLEVVEVNTTEAALLVAIGLLGTLAHLLMTWSLRFAPSATLAPMQYLEIPVATIIGFFIFSDLPNGLAAAGICITIASGLYIVLRERSIAQAEALPPASEQQRPDKRAATSEPAQGDLRLVKADP
ncbi:MAG: DMT family transporter [Pseudomonadota bacterium]